MSKIFQKPFTPEQLKASQTISYAKILQTQDNLFLYLLNRVAELESKLEQQNAGKLHIRNIK